VKLVACRSCHSQFDVSDVAEPHFECRCGATVRNETHAGVDAAVQRCAACGALLREGAESCDYCNAAVLDTSALTLSLLCPECFGRNAETSKFCTACGVEFRPEPLPSEQEDAVACPVCEQELAVRGVGPRAPATKRGLSGVLNLAQASRAMRAAAKFISRACSARP
jgi:hypothetical protein